MRPVKLIVMYPPPRDVAEFEPEVQLLTQAWAAEFGSRGVTVNVNGATLAVDGGRLAT